MPWQVYLAALLSVAACVLALLRLRAETAGATENVYVYRPLTMLAIATIAMVAPQPVSVYYKGAVVLALVMAILGEAFMMIKGTPLMVGVILVSFVGLLYFFAFASLVTLQWPTLWALLLPLLGYGVYRLLAPHLGEFWFPGVVFALLLALATWMTLELVVQQGTRWAWTALAGISLLDLGALLLGLNQFGEGFRYSRGIMHGIYLIAQWLIAVSVWGNLLAWT